MSHIASVTPPTSLPPLNVVCINQFVSLLSLRELINIQPRTSQISFLHGSACTRVFYATGTCIQKFLSMTTPPISLFFLSTSQLPEAGRPDSASPGSQARVRASLSLPHKQTWLEHKLPLTNGMSLIRSLAGHCRTGEQRTCVCVCVCVSL